MIPLKVLFLLTGEPELSHTVPAVWIPLLCWQQGHTDSLLQILPTVLLQEQSVNIPSTKFLTVIDIRNIPVDLPEITCKMTITWPVVVVPVYSITAMETRLYKPVRISSGDVIAKANYRYTTWNCYLSSESPGCLAVIMFSATLIESKLCWEGVCCTRNNV
jgi:hypothetical protein